MKPLVVALMLLTFLSPAQAVPTWQEMAHKPSLLSASLLGAGLASAAGGISGIGLARKGADLKAFRRYVLRHRVQQLFDTSDRKKLEELLHTNAVPAKAQEPVRLYLQDIQEQKRTNTRLAGSGAALLVGLAALAGAGATHVKKQDSASIAANAAAPGSPNPGS